MGWHSLLEACGHRVDFLDDEALVRLPADARDPLILPLTSIASDTLVDRIQAHRGALLAGPHTAFCDESGRLRSSRLPVGLSERLRVRLGLWHDTGPLPDIKGLPSLKGWRELEPLARAQPPHLSNGRPLLAGTHDATLCAADLGDLWTRGRNAQRQRLVRLVRPRLGV